MKRRCHICQNVSFIPSNTHDAAIFAIEIIKTVTWKNARGWYPPPWSSGRPRVIREFSRGYSSQKPPVAANLWNFVKSYQIQWKWTKNQPCWVFDGFRKWYGFIATRANGKNCNAQWTQARRHWNVKSFVIFLQLQSCNQDRGTVFTSVNFTFNSWIQLAFPQCEC